MGFFKSLFGKKNKLEDLDKINDEFLQNNPNAKNSEDAMLRNASKLMTSGKFQESLDVYVQLAADYPNNRGMYESQVGANYYFLGQYEKAIEAYVSAMNNGADKGMMDDNIWEASEAIYQKSNDKQIVQDYLTLFPAGSYKKKAEKLLNS